MPWRRREQREYLAIAGSGRMPPPSLAAHEASTDPPQLPPFLSHNKEERTGGVSASGKGDRAEQGRGTTHEFVHHSAGEPPNILPDEPAASRSRAQAASNRAF